MIIQTKPLYQMIDVEPYFILTLLLVLAWLFYKLFLRDVSDERHRNIQGHFKNILHHYLVCSAFFATFIFINEFSDEGSLKRALPYVAIISLITGMTVFVKVSRLIILQYLFLGSMRAGVPVLIVNIFSLLMSIGLAMWSANQILGLQVAPLLATSAAFSIILGLALQDTLGNLFAGLSLQIDKSFEIGDWLEIVNGTTKIVGQVKEISWRATLLIGFAEERITLPNRTLANSQISNFSREDAPIIRNQMFKISYRIDHELVKRCLLESIKEVHSVLTYPEPSVFISETTESWINYKLVYYIENYGSQYGIADQVLHSALKFLAANNIEITPARIEIIKSTIA